MKPRALSLLSFSVISSLSLGSCALDRSSGPTRFLRSTGADTSARANRLPFEHSWRDPSVDMTKYKHIVVRPVTLSFLHSERWEESKSPLIPNKRTYLRRCEALARHWNKSLDHEFSSPVCMFYKTNDTSQPGTLIFEVALTEARFEHAKPPKGAAVSGPICAFEAKTRDAATGKVISISADKRGPGNQRTDVTSVLSPNEAICDEWSQQLMQRSNVELFPKIRRNWFSF